MGLGQVDADDIRAADQNLARPVRADDIQPRGCFDRLARHEPPGRRGRHVPHARPRSELHAFTTIEVQAEGEPVIADYASEGYAGTVTLTPLG